MTTAHAKSNFNSKKSFAHHTEYSDFNQQTFYKPCSKNLVEDNGFGKISVMDSSTVVSNNQTNL